MKTALVVIDVQKYFLNDYTQDLPGKIADFIKHNQFDFLLFTKHINTPDSNFVKQLNWSEMQSAPDTDILPELTEFLTDKNVFTKNTYSIFKAPGFINFLKQNSITKLWLCGIDTDACVLASAYEAFDLGYEVKVLKDLARGHDGEEYDVAARKLIDKNIQID